MEMSILFPFWLAMGLAIHGAEWAYNKWQGPPPPPAVPGPPAARVPTTLIHLPIEVLSQIYRGLSSMALRSASLIHRYAGDVAQRQLYESVDLCGRYDVVGWATTGARTWTRRLSIRVGLYEFRKPDARDWLARVFAGEFGVGAAARRHVQVRVLVFPEAVLPHWALGADWMDLPGLQGQWIDHATCMKRCLKTVAHRTKGLCIEHGPIQDDSRPCASQPYSPRTGLIRPLPHRPPSNLHRPHPPQPLRTPTGLR